MRYPCKPVLVLQIAVIICLAGCSTQKDGIVNRAYHNTTARYNGYFYSKESIKEGVAQIKASHKDDYEEVLPVYIVPNETEALAVVSQMDRAIIKSSTVIKRHSMNIKGKERCRWIDDNYIAIGKGHFYKRTFDEAIKIFDYVIKEYKDTPARYEGMLWLVRTYVEAGSLDKAGLILGVANEDKNFPRKQKGELYKVNAVYYTARKNYAVAADNLEKAIPLEKRKKRRTRLTYILAQLYQRAGRSNDALKYFDIVAEKSADYNMVFNARIFQALSVENRVAGYKVKDDLLKMLKDDKNIEYQDQIYYALAEITFKERKDPEAVEYLKKSAAASTTNVKQKSKSFLRLAQYYFNQKLYEPAGIFYDSAVAVLPRTYPEYLQIKKTATDLGELVKELHIIQTQDSLQMLANMPEEERSKKITQVLRELQKKADEDAEKKKALANAISQPPGPPNGKMTETASVGDFYFYNVQTKTIGYNDFKKKWGTRKLEDNWRPSTKNQSEGGVAGFDESGTADSLMTSDKSTAGATIKRQDLEKDIPLTSAKRKESNDKIIQALYNSGMIYKEKFKDNENAIESFENLVARYDKNQYEATAYYQLYRMYLQKETKKGAGFFSDSKSSSVYYKDLILTEYPNSEFARLVENPEYGKEVQANVENDLSDYRKVYAQYKQNNLTEALLAVDDLIIRRPSSPILAKFYFLKARINSDLRNVDTFVDLLTLITARFPNTEEAKEAARILDALKGKLPPKALVTDTTTAKTAADTSQNAPATPVMISDYKEDAETEHYLAIVFPNKGQDTDKLKISIANFNTSMFSLKKFDITNTFLGNDNQIIIIKPFPNKKEAMDYHNVFIADKKNLKEANKEENKVFVISVDNFISLFKTRKVEDYLVFFEEKYKK